MTRPGFAVLAVLAIACRPSTESSGRASASAGAERLVRGGTGSAKVTYQPNVRVLERDEGIAALTDVSTDGTTLLFESAPASIRSIAPGDVLLIKGLLARKVLDVDAQGAQVAILTTRATLGEVIRDGHVELSAPIRFTRSLASATPVPPRRDGSPWESALSLVVPAAHAQGAKVAKSLGEGAVKAIVNDWKATYSVVPGDGRMDIALTMTRDVGGFKGVIKGTGYVEDFDLSSGIDVSDGVVDRLDVAFKRMNGVMNFTWEIGKDTPGGYAERDRIKLPGAITIPLYKLLDGFPLFLEVSAAIIVQPVITGGMQYSHGAFRVTYDGAQGFKAKEGTIDAEGKVSGDIKFLEDRHVSALAPVGMVVNIAAPRIELTMNPLKMLSDISGKDNLQKQIGDAAKKVDKIADFLKKRTLSAETNEQLKSFPFTMGKVADAMKSDAAAYIQVVTTSAVSNSGMSALGGPCTNTDLGVLVSVGAKAEAFGQNVGKTEKVVFQTALKKVDPPSSRVCG